MPGVLFVIFAEVFTDYSLWQKNLVAGFFLYYFIGMVISRIGSLIIEPFLKWIGLLKKADYKMFVHAEEGDEKVSILSEQNNQYRTIIALFVVIGILKAWETIFQYIIPNKIGAALLFILLLVLFLYSYSKQTRYIVDRKLQYSVTYIDCVNIYYVYSTYETHI